MEHGIVVLVREYAMLAVGLKVRAHLRHASQLWRAAAAASRVRCSRRNRCTHGTARHVCTRTSTARTRRISAVNCAHIRLYHQIIQYSVLWQKWVHSKCSGIKGSMYKVMKTWGCVNPVTGTGRTSLDIGVNANLDLVDKCLFRWHLVCLYVCVCVCVCVRVRVNCEVTNLSKYGTRGRPLLCTGLL